MNKVFMPEGIYTLPPSNVSHDAWMSLFPSKALRMQCHAFRY
jgi:hypothetical protein